MGTTGARSRILVGLAATAGAIGAAAMMSAATPPTARADDFSDIVSAVNGDYTEGSAAFSSAFSDFGSSDVSQGFGQLVDAFDDYSLSPAYNLVLGTGEALEGDPITGSIAWGIPVPSDFASGVSLAESFSSEGQTLVADGASAFGSGDYAIGTADSILVADYVSILPLEELFLGAAVSF